MMSSKNEVGNYLNKLFEYGVEFSLNKFVKHRIIYLIMMKFIYKIN
jgi:hypothetical protein